MRSAEAELLADRLFTLGASAVSELPGADDAAPAVDRDRTVVLVADVDPADVLDANGVVAAGFEGVLGVRVLDQEPGWDTAWHRSARAWPCGQRLLVRPHWVPSPRSDVSGAAGRIEVVLDPGPSFGAGSHPSTRACLAVLEPLAPSATRVLDVGCGTGVLGIAALLLGESTLTAIDIDPAAVIATTSAAELNGVSGRARVAPTPLDSVEGTFDLVLANLLLPVVEELAPELAAHTARGGAIVVGGLLEHQLDRAVAALGCRGVMSVQAVHRDDGWVAAVLRGDGSAPTTGDAPVW